MPSPRERLRELLSGPGAVVPAPVFDALSARIAQTSGWDLIKLPGSSAKAALTALPDINAMFTNNDLVEACQRITRVVDLPLIVDADDARGGTLTARRLVQDLESVGVAAIELEDVAVPESAGPASKDQVLVSVEAHVAKLEAAVAARRDPLTMIVARTSSPQNEPFEAALARIQAYGQTGAEALMLPYVPPGGRDGLRQVAEAFGAPLWVRRLTPDMLADTAFLAEANIGMWFVPPSPFHIALRAYADALEHLRTGGDPDELEPLRASQELLSTILHKEELAAFDRDFPTEPR